jgi:tetratricopeptide (TPR) repeat protein
MIKKCCPPSSTYAAAALLWALSSFVAPARSADQQSVRDPAPSSRAEPEGARVRASPPKADRPGASDPRRLTAADMIDWIAQMQQNRCSNSSALDQLTVIAPITEEMLEDLFDEAESYYRSGDTKRAFEAFRSLVELAPDDARAWLRIGNLHWAQGSIESAIQAFTRAQSIGVDQVGAVQAWGATPEPTAQQLRNRPARAKATINLIELQLEQARRAIATIDASDLQVEARNRYQLLRDQLGTSVPIADAGATLVTTRGTLNADRELPANADRDVRLPSGTVELSSKAARAEWSQSSARVDWSPRAARADSSYRASKYARPPITYVGGGTAQSQAVGNADSR